MSNPRPLLGKTIVVTRPAAQAEGLASAIRVQGGTVLLYPLLEIGPPAETAALQAAAGRLTDFALAIFISPNAVDYSLPTLLAGQAWPVHLVPAAVGQGTVKTLAGYGITGCVAPTVRFDSEALLDCPALQSEQVAGKQIAIFRGDGGRELLAETLRERGASVTCIPCYRRLPPARSVQVLMEAWQQQLDAITISSSEGLRYLLERLDASGRALLKQTPVFVPHARIAENAAALGLEKIILTAGADAGILEGLCKYHW
jgi:uroporphyrinogen-III synthase